MGKAQLFKLPKDPPGQEPPVIALAGNPNTGKSTIFNLLTGLRQHTGNWPGKTVLLSRGSCFYQQQEYNIVDLPGTYSLLANSPEEESARDFICFARPQATVVVADATCLERNLNLILQILEITSDLIVCVNLLDEARRKHISIDIKALAEELGVPVVAAVASRGRGINSLKEAIRDMVEGKTTVSPRNIIYEPEVEMALQQIERQLKGLAESHNINRRWLALRLLYGDSSILEKLSAYMSPEDKVWA
ncbi:MAG TPA: FeoB small GTPase domain-containing protein [Syntrophomonadaceae bacterium]|nr:FeoB small GTPase domain-containing protein [Syntrophomonadaceae bacterium]HPR94198.1 FeoB small GTPase domain-containing protein [Syntrophomonadaceae bacterium]